MDFSSENIEEETLVTKKRYMARRRDAWHEEERYGTKKR
jgi:hypothetical protein